MAAAYQLSEWVLFHGGVVVVVGGTRPSPACLPAGWKPTYMRWGLQMGKLPITPSMPHTLLLKGQGGCPHRRLHCTAAALDGQQQRPASVRPQTNCHPPIACQFVPNYQSPHHPPPAQPATQPRTKTPPPAPRARAPKPRPPPPQKHIPTQPTTTHTYTVCAPAPPVASPPPPPPGPLTDRPALLPRAPRPRRG